MLEKKSSGSTENTGTWNTKKVPMHLKYCTTLIYDSKNIHLVLK